MHNNSNSDNIKKFRWNRNKNNQNVLTNFLDKLENELRINTSIQTKEIIDKNILSLKKSINDVWNNIISLNSNNLHLVVGQIQSGKTNFIIGLISKIIDNINNNKSMIIINLTSSILNIQYQNIRRFKDFFNTIDIDKKISLFENKDLKLIKENINDNKIFFLIKNIHHLNNIKKYIEYLNDEFSENIDRVIIIDDEGDNASFNTNDIQKDLKELSTINRLINEIIKSHYNFCVNYISITATPFIHFFASNDNNIKPDFAYLLKPGNNYLSISEFNEEINNMDSNVIIPIPNNEILTEDNSFTLTYSIKEAILCFFFTSALINENEINPDMPRMIINVSIKNDNQENLYSNINHWLYNYAHNKHLFKNDVLEINIFKFIRNDFYDLDFVNNEENKLELIECVFEKYIRLVKYEIIVYNGDNNENFDQESKNKLQIIIGGYKLSRGITIKGLTTVYMSFRAKQTNADTLLQRARWLGYRKNNLKKLRIFLTEELIDDYSKVGELIEDLYSAIAKIELNNSNSPFKQLQKFLKVISPKWNLSPNGQNRAQTQVIENTFKNKFIKNNYFNDPMNELKDKFLSTWNIKKEYIGIYPSIHFPTLLEFIDKWFNFSEDKFFNNLNAKYEDKIFIKKYFNYPIYIRFITTDLNNIKYRERVITKKNDSGVHFFGNGNYENENEIKEGYLKIDILPLKIWEKLIYEEIKEEKLIYRMKLTIPIDNEDDMDLNSGYISKE